MKQKLMMGRIIVACVWLLVILGWPLASRVLQAEYEDGEIDSILCTNGFTAQYLPSALTDGNLSTVWRTTTGTEETALVISLAQPMRIIGLEFYLTEARFAEFEVEYYQDGGWHTFTGGEQIEPGLLPRQWRTVDLSYDRVTADTLRVHLRKPGGSGYIGGIAELKVRGYRDGFRKNIPATAITTSNSETLFAAANLGDGNTESAWETEADADGAARVELEIPASRLSLVKLFVKNGLKGNLIIDYEKNGQWLPLPGAVFSSAQLAPGWNRLTVPEVKTGRVRLTFTNPVAGRLGGLTEVQLWGESSGNEDKVYYDSGLHRAVLSLLRPKALVRFEIPRLEPDAQYFLLLSIDGLLPPAMELNGNKLQPQGLFWQCGGTVLFRIPVNDYLNAGENHLTLDSVLPLKIFHARIEAVRGTGALNAVHRNLGGLFDGWLETQAGYNRVFDVDYRSRANLEWVQIYTNTPLNYLRVQADNGQGWVDVYTVQTQYPHFVQIDIPQGVTAQRMRYHLPSFTQINEIQSWGSWVRGETPPVITQLVPAEGQIYPVGQSTMEVTGVIDQLEADVRVDGKPVVFNGEHFRVTLPLYQGPVRDLNIQAQTAGNGVTVERRRVFIRNAPEFSLDQNQAVYNTKAGSFQVSGSANGYCDRITVNDIRIPLYGGKFSYNCPLKEGENILTVAAYDKQAVYTTRRLLVYRDTTAPQVTVKTPLTREVAGGAALEVSGAVADLTPVTVTVNGQAAQIDGNRFHAWTGLTLGSNTVKVVATDLLGNSTAVTVSLEHLQLQPKLVVTQPQDGRILNAGSGVTVAGTVDDTRPVELKVNSSIVALNGRGFQTYVSLAEGSQTIRVAAANDWGYRSERLLNVLIDETPPEAFEVKAEPSGWSSETQPVLTFETVDRISGIARYLVKIDDGEYTVAGSPYQVPALSDGEHPVIVKAVDRAGWETVSSTTLYVDTTAPAAVTGFKAVPGADKVNLSWTANAETDLQSYRLTRVPAFADGKAKAIGPGLSQYEDTEVTNLTGYIYTLEAVDRADNHGPGTTLAPVKAGLTEVKASPAEETKVEFENIVVGVPVGALDQTRTITVMEVKGAEALLQKSLAVSVSPVYSLSAQSSTGPVDPNGVKFNKPVLVGIHFELPGDDVKQFLNKGNLRAYYYNTAAGNWEMIPESFVDGDNNVVYFFTTHFSMFSVQASVAAPLAPEQISGMGISPGKTYMENNQVGVSYGSGSSTVTAKDFVLPGRGGLDLTISRTYDSGRGQADWGLEEDHLFSAMFSFISVGGGWLNLAKNIVAQAIDKYLAEPAGSFGFGRGWRMNFVWIEKDENGQFIHLPGGGSKKINWKMTGSGWGGQGKGVFECHAGEHFILEQTQRKVGDIYSDDESGNGVKTGENWEATGYVLTTKDGTRYEMNGGGLVQRIVNRLGTSEITFRFNGKKLDYIIDSVGRKIQFTYSGKFIRSISGAGKTVTYQYDGHDELVKVNDGGLQETKYGYDKYTFSSGSWTVSLLDILTIWFNPSAWINLVGALIPNANETDVYYLTQVVTPFNGEYRFDYGKQQCIRYGDFGSGLSLSIGMMWFEFAKVNRFEENGLAYDKVQTIDYKINYDKNNAPIISSCNIYEGDRRTYMLFDRISNSVEKDVTLLKAQMVYGRQDRMLSAHLVEYDPELEAPVKVTDNTGGRSTVQEFKYDNWGNVVWQKNHHTGAESFAAYANTASSVSYPGAMKSPYATAKVAGTIHDAKTGEYIINYNGSQASSQQTHYQFAENGNLLEKAVRSGSKWLKTGYEYDDAGNITKMTSPTGIETFYEYADAYQQALLTKVTLGKLTNADGNAQTGVVLKELGYDPVTYRKRWEKDARGFVTEYQQDSLGREILTVLPDDTDSPDYRPAALTGAIERSGFRSDNPIQQMSYDDANRTTRVTDPLGNRTDYIYDSFEHLTEIVKYHRILGLSLAYSRVKVGYDDQGRIASIISPLGTKNSAEAHQYTTRYLYDEAGRLLRIIYPDGTSDDGDNPYKAYSYNEVTNEVTITESASATELHETLVTKDAVDRVIAQVAGYRSDAATASAFSYDALGNRTAETDGRGNTTLFVYDDQNRLVQKTLPETEALNDPAGVVQAKRAQLSYTYDDEGNLIREISPLGRAVTYVFDEMNREIITRTAMTGRNGSQREIVSKVYYDLAGNKVKTVDPNGKATEYVYTARGWLQSVKDPAGGITSYTYDPAGNKLSETDARGNAAGAVKNSYTAWYVYDDLYRVVKAVLPDQTPPDGPDNPGDNPVITFQYDENGNCIRETKANGEAIDYTYNGRNWLLTQRESLNGVTYTTRFEYDWIGNKRFVYDNKDNATEYRYDALNRPVLQISPEGNATSYEYDLSGNRRIVRDGMLNETEYVYDAANRLTQVIDADQKSSYSYYNEEGQLTKTVTATGLATMFRLNELGLPLEIVDSLNHKRSFDYDPAGNVIYGQDPRGTETAFEYDDLYRVLRRDFTNGVQSQYLSCEYDQVGNIRRANNGQVELVYNDGGDFGPFNRIEKVEQIRAGGARHTTEYRYDPLTGATTGIRYPGSGAWLEYQYDRMGRLTAIPGFAGTAAQPGFAYDENSAIRAVATDNGVSTAYQRDKDGRITGIAATKAGAEVLRLNYAYDKANNITQRNDNSYVYDKVNRLRQATIGGSFQDKFTKADLLLGTADQDYQGAKDAEEDVTDQTAIKLDYAARSLIFNLQTEAENLARIELVPERAGHRIPLAQIEIYYRNGFGFTKLERERWTGVKDASGKITIKFTPLLAARELKIHCNYDDLDLMQLPVDRSEFFNTPEKLVTIYQKIRTRIETYDYDAMGNRTVEKLQLRKEHRYNYTYVANSNRLQSKVKQDGTERVDYEYDANGNLTVKVVTKSETVDRWEYAYDLLNQLEQVKKNGVMVSSYIYDPNGFRIEKNGGKGKIHYVPLLNGEVGYRKEISADKEYSFVYVGGQKLARVNGVIGSTGQKFFYQNDHLGSALAVTDENGNKVVERDFTPFGERINTDIDDDEPGDVDEDDSGFTGKDFDEDAGLYYYNARWYDPEIGRFVTEDSVDDPNNPNKYVYVANNPVNTIDPSGHISLDISGGLMNLASMYIPGLSTFMQGFNTFNLFINSKGNIVNMITGNFTIGYTGTANTGMQDQDGEIAYQESSKYVYKHFKLVKTERSQTFENQNGDTITVRTVESSGQTSQEYAVTKADGTRSTQTVNYVADMPNQKNQISVEGFISNNETGMEALKLVVTRNGVEAAFQASTLPQGGYRDVDGTYKTTGENKVVAEGTYGMYSWRHGGGTWQYDNAIQLGDDALYTSMPVSYSGVVSINANGEQIPIMTAVGVNDHASQRGGRSSSACQNTAAYANWFSIGSNGPQQHAGVSVNQRRNPDKGYVNHADINRYWPTWAAWSDIMVPHTATQAATKGQFIGYYYLNRL